MSSFDPLTLQHLFVGSRTSLDELSLRAQFHSSPP
jgi:hypothetical protein